MAGLREGDKYKFLVERELILPDGSKHFLLKGEESTKYLIPLKRYSHYGIVTGSEIICSVDRINCKGEIFLEPQNPWYAEGKSYSFIVAGKEVRTDNSGKNHDVVIVTDKSGDRISVPHNTNLPFPAIGTKLKYRVERISKGKVHLMTILKGTEKRSLKPGSSFEFVIERIEKGMNDEEYFVVKDPFGTMHTISKEYYEYYGLTVGTRFRGKIIKYRKDGEKTIEPENPFYKTGSVIKLEVTGTFESVINSSFTITLKDKFGFTHCIETAMAPSLKSIYCRVVMIKKGRPLLEPM
jgi:hypothetical protein